MTGETAFVGGTGIIAHVADTPVYTAPAARAFYVAPAGRTFVAPAGHTPPHEVASGIGIAVDRSA